MQRITGIVESPPLSFSGRIAFPLHCNEELHGILCLSRMGFECSPPEEGDLVELEGERQEDGPRQSAPRFLFRNITVLKKPRLALHHA